MMASPGQSQTQVEVTERDPNDGRRHVDEEIWHKGREPQEEAEQQHVLLLGLPPRAHSDDPIRAVWLALELEASGAIAHGSFLLRRWLRIFPREPCSRVKRALQTEAERAHCHLLEAPSSSRPGYSGAPE